MSTFSKATDRLVSQIDPNGGLIPACSVYSADKLDLMKLVVKKERSFVWQKPKYLPSIFTLSDLLRGKHQRPLRSAFLPEINILSYKGKSGNMVDGKVGDTADIAGAGVGATLEGKVTTKDQSSVGEIKKQQVDVKKLLHEVKNRQLNMQHVLLKQLKKKVRKPVLTLLTERIVTTSTWNLSEHFSFEEKLELTAKTILVPVEFSSNVQCDSDDSMVIPPGAVLAYKLVDLDVEKDGSFELCLFGGDGELCLFGGDGDIVCDAMPDDDVDGLVPELENLCLLAEIPRSARSALFQSLCEVLKDRDALSDVENTLDEWCAAGVAPVQTEGDGSVSHSDSASVLLDLLSHIPEGPLTAVHLLVSAMEALPDEALNLLSESRPDVLEAFNELLNMLHVRDLPVACCSPPLKCQRLPLPLRDDEAYDWAQRLLVTSNLTLERTEEAGRLHAETGSDLAVLPLVLCITAHGLSSLCDQLN